MAGRWFGSSVCLSSSPYTGRYEEHYNDALVRGILRGDRVPGGYDRGSEPAAGS